MGKSRELIIYILISCVSFAILSTVLSFLAIFDLVMIMTNIVNLQLFCCTITIAIALWITDRINTQSLFTEIAIQFFVVLVIVLFLGYIFNWYSIHVEVITLVIFITAVVYFTTYAIMIYLSRVTTDKINMIIKKRKDD